MESEVRDKESEVRGIRRVKSGGSRRVKSGGYGE